MSSRAAEALDVAITAARAGAAVLREVVGQGGARHVEHKGVIDLVTEADRAAEDAVLAVLARLAPGVPVLAEEAGGAWDSSTRWIVDPLDGTTNFVHGLPHFAVSVALEQQGEIIAGCVLDPSREEEWAAALGQGATLNGAPIAVSSCSELSQAVLATGFAYDRNQRAAYYLRLVQAFMERCQGIRRAGAAALDLAWLAAGRLDGFWELGLSPWDVAAGVLIVQEAGGRVTDADGGPLRLLAPRLLASNGNLHKDMHGVLATLLSSPEHEGQEKSP
ncbi:MAG: inositol monophosphatase [Oligoflexia bacterium]|nr:inositol monophosphatase [Oligoflexia bacterium]